MTVSEKADNIKLHVLGGKPPPAAIIADVIALNDLSGAAQAAIWRALGPSLDEPVTPNAEQSLEAFAKEFAVEATLLARAIRSLRFLVREGVRRGLDARLVAEDVDNLLRANGLNATEDLPPLPGDAPHSLIGGAIILAGYDRARAYLSAKSLAKAVKSHTSMLASVDWRLDRVLASPESERLGADMALLVLEIDKPDGQHETLRFHADLSRVQALGAACEAILSSARRHSTS